MRISPRFRYFLLCASLLCTGSALLAQGPPGQDPYNPPPGHGGMPPGQAKKHGDERGMPPGQAKKYFRDQDRAGFYSYYHHDADRWRARHRPAFMAGQYIDRQYAIRPVPRSVWVKFAAPPPAGYQYGYYGGYVVAYNPTTRIVADVLDIVAAATYR
jgi:hypothetical protein